MLCWHSQRWNFVHWICPVHAYCINFYFLFLFLLLLLLENEWRQERKTRLPGLVLAAVASRSRVATSARAQTASAGSVVSTKSWQAAPRSKASMPCVEQCAVPRMTHEGTKKVKRSALFYLVTSLEPYEESRRCCHENWTHSEYTF